MHPFFPASRRVVKTTVVSHENYEAVEKLVAKDRSHTTFSVEMYVPDRNNLRKTLTDKSSASFPTAT